MPCDHQPDEPQSFYPGHLMRLRRITGLLLVWAFALTSPSATLADHCGGSATVVPASGPAGTRFVFATNLGASSDIHLYRDGVLIRSDFLAGTGDVDYTIETQPGDVGAWTVRAEVQGHPECGSEAAFTVIEAPEAIDTSTQRDNSVAYPLVLVVLAAALIALGAVVIRSWHRGTRGRLR